VVDDGSPTDWAVGLLGRNPGGLVMWTPAETDAERQGLAVADRPGVRAASIASAQADPRLVALTLRVAGRLAAQRRDHAAACLTSWSRPDVPDRAVRVPHLVTLHRDDGQLVDVVVWELTRPQQLQRWLGRTEPDLELVERHLDRLVRLRTAARTGRLPATTAAMELTALLDGRGLTVEIVYRHPALFRVLLGEPWPPR
jgi:hypothetical protein